MNSKIIITRSSAKKSGKSRNSKTNEKTFKRSSKSKFEDIDLGSTIGDIYRKSRSKSVSTNNKKIVHNASKSMVSNRKPSSNYYNNSKPIEPDNDIKKHIILNKSSKPPIMLKYNPKINLTVPTSKPQVVPTSKPQVVAKVKEQREVNVKNSTLYRPKVNNYKDVNLKYHNNVIKNISHPPKSKSNYNRSKTKTYNTPTVKKDILAIKTNNEINDDVVNKTTHSKYFIEKDTCKYKEILVRTNLNSFEEISKLVYPEIINKLDTIDNDFTQFTDVTDKYIMAMISGGIDIKKYTK
jgi:hypothetical protein